MEGSGEQSGAAAIGIQHVALEVSAEELERAADFWRLVGFGAVEPPLSLRERALWFEAGPEGAKTQIHLLLGETDASVPTGDSPSAAGRGGNHVAIVVRSWDQTVRALSDAGFTIEQRRPHWGAERAFAAHPGGHTVELMASPPPPAG